MLKHDEKNYRTKSKTMLITIKNFFWKQRILEAVFSFLFFERNYKKYSSILLNYKKYTFRNAWISL